MELLLRKGSNNRNISNTQKTKTPLFNFACKASTSTKEFSCETYCTVFFCTNNRKITRVVVFNYFPLHALITIADKPSAQGFPTFLKHHTHEKNYTMKLVLLQKQFFFFRMKMGLLKCSCSLDGLIFALENALSKVM